MQQRARGRKKSRKKYQPPHPHRDRSVHLVQLVDQLVQLLDHSGAPRPGGQLGGLAGLALLLLLLWSCRRRRRATRVPRGLPRRGGEPVAAASCRCCCRCCWRHRRSRGHDPSSRSASSSSSSCTRQKAVFVVEQVVQRDVAPAGAKRSGQEPASPRCERVGASSSSSSSRSTTS